MILYHVQCMMFVVEIQRLYLLTSSATEDRVEDHDLVRGMSGNSSSLKDCTVAKQKGELIVVGFDYSPLEAQVAERVRSSTEAIRQQVRNTMESAIQIGQELLTVKEALPHGQFLPWLQAEFGWAERTARNFMAVDEQFGKSAIIADLPIQPTAAYLLAAPSVPDEARQVAIKKAEAGEQITVAEAKEIVAEAKKKRRPKRKKLVPTNKLGLRLEKVLERYRERWNPDELAALARQLREFADALEKPEGGRKKGRGESPCRPHRNDSPGQHPLLPSPCQPGPLHPAGR